MTDKADGEPALNAPSTPQTSISQTELDEIIKRNLTYLRHGGNKLSLTDRLIDGLVIQSGTKFDHMDLTNTRFVNVDLTDCTFVASSLGGADFSQARLFRCTFSHSRRLGFVRFGSVVEVSFEGLTFSDTSFHENTFNQCTFSNVSFMDSRLEYTNFVNGCQFVGCNFTETKSLKYVHFNGAWLSDCNLKGADLETSDGFIFDATDVRDTRLPVRSRDPWSILVRGYTGSIMVFNLLFLAIFFTPLIGKAVMLTLLAHLEASLLTRLSTVYSEIIQRTHGINISPITCDMLQCRSVPVWRALIGSNTSAWLWVSGLALLFYNMLQRPRVKPCTICVREGTRRAKGGLR